MPWVCNIKEGVRRPHETQLLFSCLETLLVWPALSLLPLPCSLLLGGGGGRILEEEGGSFWVVFILEDRHPHDVQGEARNTVEDLEVISLQREGITSSFLPHHTSYFLCKNSKYKRQLDLVYRIYFSILCFLLFRICDSIVLFG